MNEVIREFKKVKVEKDTKKFNFTCKPCTKYVCKPFTRHSI